MARLIRLFGRRATPSEYGVAYLEHNIPHGLPAKTILGARILLENTGQKVWPLHHPEGKRVDLVVLCDSNVWATHHLPRDAVHPGERVTIHFPLRVPAAAGRYSLKFDLVEQGVTRFEDQGVRPLTLNLR